MWGKKGSSSLSDIETMYIGQYLHSLDTKNRLFLPAKFRDRNKEFIITRGLENCLYIYDREGWAKVLDKLENLSLPDKVQERAFKRALLSGAFEATTDAQGRILVPQHLKDYARITADITIVGVGSRLELWERLAWEEYYRQHAEVSFKSLAGQLEI